jgi:hypothetical protein
MNTNTYSRTNGIVGVTILALFAIAIIAGQAHGKLDDMNSMHSDLPTAIDLGVLVESAAPVGFEVSHEAIRKFRTTPVMVEFGVEMISLTSSETDQPTGPRTSF